MRILFGIHKIAAEFGGFHVPGAPELHQAVIAGEYVEPALEIVHLVHPQLGMQFVEDVHDGILAAFGVFEILEADAEYEVHIPLVEYAQQVHIAGLLIGYQQFFVGGIPGRYVL